MAKSSADDAELRRACAAAVAASGARGEEVAFSIRVAKGHGIFEKLGRLAKPRVLALTGERSPPSPSSPHLCPRFGLLCCAALRCERGVGLLRAPSWVAWSGFGACLRGLCRVHW